VTKVHYSSVTEHWATPQELLNELHEEFAFDLDPCPLCGSPDGLLIPWKRRRVFCNPPYGPGIRKWLLQGTEADVAVFLLPARTDTRWFHEIVLPGASEIRFIAGRIGFERADGLRSRAPFPSMIVIFRCDTLVPNAPMVSSSPQTALPSPLSSKA
jgi:site-specific DNA-methyltransferase (adenine-specific)